MTPRHPAHVLLVDDEPIILSTVKSALVAGGYRVTTASSSADAAARLRDDTPDVVVTDVNLEGLNGTDLLHHAKAVDPDVTVLVITGYCDVASAVESLRLGAEDYLSKPFDFDELLLRVARCAETRDLRRRVRRYEALVAACPTCGAASQE